MHLNYVIQELDAAAEAVDFPGANPDFEKFQRDLKSVLHENCSPAIANSLSYCDHTRTFMVRLRESRKMELPVGDDKSNVQSYWVTFECVRTIEPLRSIYKQIEDLSAVVKQGKMYCDLVAPFSTMTQK